MQNIDMRREGNLLHITIDLSRDCGPSKSGKTRIIATTAGNKRLDDGVFLGVNCYRGDVLTRDSFSRE